MTKYAIEYWPSGHPSDEAPVRTDIKAESDGEAAEKAPGVWTEVRKKHPKARFFALVQRKVLLAWKPVDHQDL